MFILMLVLPTRTFGWFAFHALSSSINLSLASTLISTDAIFNTNICDLSKAMHGMHRIWNLLRPGITDSAILRVTETKRMIGTVDCSQCFHFQNQNFSFLSSKFI